MFHFPRSPLCPFRATQAPFFPVITCYPQSFSLTGPEPCRAPCCSLRLEDFEMVIPICHMLCPTGNSVQLQSLSHPPQVTFYWDLSLTQNLNSLVAFPSHTHNSYHSFIFRTFYCWTCYIYIFLNAAFYFLCPWVECRPHEDRLLMLWQLNCIPFQCLEQLLAHYRC